MAALCGIAFSGYCVIISVLGLVQGPYCLTSTGWRYAFKNSNGGYLNNFSSWSQCFEPAFIVEWNIILFSILLGLSGTQVILCFSQVLRVLAWFTCGSYSSI
nr:PREDICTED: transmembrane 4 L6 family member 18 [Latimeria chalumnae]|eukprot:XP_006007919.1 PREDICTED: transmembrane 4 L6 family member 18 [Latimeria chalumnae]